MVLLRVADRTLGVISFAVLARILLPEHFGLLALAASLGGLLELSSEFSVELALIRAPQDDRRLYDSAWTMKILRSAAISCILVLLAPVAAQLFAEPRIELVVYCLAVASLLAGFENIGVVEFRKHMTFEKEFSYLFLSRILSTAVTVTLALLWRNYWALIAGVLTQKATQVALSYLVHPYRPVWSLSGFSELFHFSKWMVVQNFVHGFNQRMPGWVIGRLAGVGPVAHYEVASEIATLTTSELRAPIRRALYPGFAKLASDAAGLRKSFLDAYGLMTLVGLPIPIGLGLLAPWLVHLFLGNQWEAAVPVLEVLALYGVVQALGSSSHLIYLVINRPALTAKLDGLQSLILIPLLVIGVTMAGPAGAAWALTIAALILLLVDFTVILKIMDIPFQRIAVALARPVAGSIAMVGGLILVRRLLPEAGWWMATALQLGTLVGTGVLLYAGTVLLLWRLAGRPEGSEQHLLSLIREVWKRFIAEGIKYFGSNQSSGGSEAPSVIVFGSNEWNDHWQTRQFICSRVGRLGWSVVYTTGAGDWWERGTPAWRAKPWRGHTVRKDHVDVYVAGKIDARVRKIAVWDRWALRRHARKLMGLAGWASASRRIAYVFDPRFWPYLEHLGDCTVVYHADDAFSLMPDWEPGNHDMQVKLVAQADLLFSTSPGVARMLASAGASQVHYLPNGADVETFIAAEDLPCPPDLATIPHPRIGYVGSVNLKVDLSLVADIARRRPDWHWVIVGGVRDCSIAGFPGNAEFQHGMAACKRLGNVHFLGTKPHDHLPAYMAYMDVNTMCYRTTPDGWWTAIYPLKLHEYLAIGKPIVAANLEALREFSSTLAIADTPAEWTRALEIAITAGGIGTKSERRDAAGTNSWDCRVEELVRLISVTARHPCRVASSGMVPPPTQS